MKTAFLIHGAYGNPEENWFPWLKKELEELGYLVVSPTFPTPENQSLETWNKVFEEHLKDVNDDSILVGHSLGCPFILNLLQDNEVKINGVFLVAGFHVLIDHPIDEINKSFVVNIHDFEKIKSNCNRIIMFSGDNDPYIRIEISNELAQKLDADYTVIPNGGHLNKTSGYMEFEELLGKIVA